MRHLQQLDSRVKFSIVTDQPHEQSFSNLGVNVFSAPASFKPPKALYKARALEWFRLQAKLDDNDWVLHLDEETIVDDHTIKACLNFVETETEFDMGQVCLCIFLDLRNQITNAFVLEGDDYLQCLPVLGTYFECHGGCDPGPGRLGEILLGA